MACSCLQPLESISLAEDRKSKHHTDPTITGPPLKKPLAPHSPQSAALPETWSPPGYVAWLQLQYQQQLETAIFNMSGSAMSRLAYPQADAQHFPQFPSSTAAATGLETAYLQASLDSPFANQQWMDDRAPQVVLPASPEAGSGQNMQYSTELPAVAAYNPSSPNAEYLMLMAQQSMINAAGGAGQANNSRHAVGQAQFGGEQQLHHFCMLVCASVLCLAWSCPLLQVCSRRYIIITVADCRCVTA